MLRYCTILPHAPIPCAAIMACRGIAPFYPTLLHCAAIMSCRAIAPFYPTLLSLVLLLWHADVLPHSTPRSSPLCCYYAMPRYCTILPHAPLPCAAIMPCRGIAPFYPTLVSLVLLLWHAEVLHHSTPRTSPVCCYYAMPMYCTILPHAPPLCCYYAMPMYCTILPHAPPVCCYYAMSSYCTILPHAPLMCCYYAMPRYCTILPHAPLPCAAIMACRGIAPLYTTLLPCAAIMPCQGIAPFYPTLLSRVLLLCNAEVLHHSTTRSSPLCCYYAMPRYCTILPHAPLPCAAIMPCRGIAPFYPFSTRVLLLWHAEVLHHSTPRSSRVLLLCHAELLHHSTPRSSPLCCYYGMPRYCTILPHAPLPCAVIMACRGIAPFYPTRLYLVLLLWHAVVLHHSTPRSSPLCCCYAMPRYCTILPHAPPLCCYYAMSSYCTILPHAPLPCAAIMACRGIAPFYPTLLPCAASMAF